MTGVSTGNRVQAQPNSSLLPFTCLWKFLIIKINSFLCSSQLSTFCSGCWFCKRMIIPGQTSAYTGTYTCKRMHIWLTKHDGVFCTQSREIKAINKIKVAHELWGIFIIGLEWFLFEHFVKKWPEKRCNISFFRICKPHMKNRFHIFMQIFSKQFTCTFQFGTSLFSNGVNFQSGFIQMSSPWNANWVVKCSRLFG